MKEVKNNMSIKQKSNETFDAPNMMLFSKPQCTPQASA